MVIEQTQTAINSNYDESGFSMLAKYQNSFNGNATVGMDATLAFQSLHGLMNINMVDKNGKKTPENTFGQIIESNNDKHHRHLHGFMNMHQRGTKHNPLPANALQRLRKTVNSKANKTLYSNPA